MYISPNKGKRKIRVCGLSNQDTAVFWYRIVQPLQEIARQKLALVHHLPIFGQHSQHLTSVEFREYQALEGKWADILFTTLGTDRYYLSVLLAMKEQYKLKLVVDLDDSILETHLEPNNPAFGAYMNEDGRHALYAQYCLAQADLVTTSTEYLREKYKGINPNIVVVPNCISKGFFPATSTPDEVTIGYAGSASHQKDWEMVEPVLGRLKEKYGVKIKVLGPLATHIPIDEQVSWVDTLKYPQALADMGFSIGIAPLKDSAMNRAKSNLRWLEYSSLKIPTVASSVVPFKGIHNIRYATEPEDWETHLSFLISNPEKRTELGEAAYTEMRTQFDLSTHARNLHSALTRL